MIHTFEIIKSIKRKDIKFIIKYLNNESLTDSDCCVIEKKLTAPLKKRSCAVDYSSDINKIIDLENDLKNYDTQTKKYEFKIAKAGIKNGKIIRNCYKRYADSEHTKVILHVDFYLILEINPHALINQNDTYTINLYQASKENNDLLIDVFDKEMREKFNDDKHFKHLFDLSLWNAHRIDYTINFKFNTKEEANLFYKQVHKTSLYKRTCKLKIKGIKYFEQSVAEKNNSYKTICYDKYEEIKNTYNDFDINKLNKLLEEAKNVIRFECQLKKSALLRIRKKYNSTDNSILFFLSEDIAKEELIRHYDKTIGKGDFYHRERAKQKINETITRADVRCALISFLQLIAQSKSLDAAKESFVSRSYEAAGDIKTFRRRLKRLEDLNISPVLITDDEKIRFLNNPREKIRDN